MFLSQIVAAAIFGLPAHPLVVHAAVVLVPLAAIGFFAVGWNHRWRHIYYLPVTLMALAGGAAAFVAGQTGESLQETVRQAGKHAGDHPEQGNAATLASVAFAGACLAVYVYNRYGEKVRERLGLSNRYRLPVSDDIVLYVLVLPLAFLAVATMVVAGHSGAKLVWSMA